MSNIRIIPGEYYLTIQAGDIKVMIPNTDIPQNAFSLKWAEGQIEEYRKYYSDAQSYKDL